MEPLSIQQKKDVRAVIAAVAQLYSLGPYDRAYALLRGKVERQHAITRPRHLAMYALRRWYGFKWWEVGYAFNRQHSTAADGVGQLEAELRSEEHTLNSTHTQ